MTNASDLRAPNATFLSEDHKNMHLNVATAKKTHNCFENTTNRFKKIPLFRIEGIYESGIFYGLSDDACLRFFALVPYCQWCYKTTIIIMSSNTLSLVPFLCTRRPIVI